MQGIYGIGTDVLDLQRFSKVIVRWGDRFLEKVYTEIEMRTCLDQEDRAAVRSLAARFCVKEAVFKALSLGIGQHGLGFRDVWLERKGGSKPFPCFSEKYRQYLERHGIGDIFVSLSHSVTIAQSFVVACQKERKDIK